MSLLDRFVAAVTPPEREQARMEARAKAHEAARSYPALIRAGQKSLAMAGYAEQASAKANLGALEFLDPMTEDFMDKLEHIRNAVLRHMYEEESDRFLDLRRLSTREQQHLTERFREEFERYAGGSAGVGPEAGSPPSASTGATGTTH